MAEYSKMSLAELEAAQHDYMKEQSKLKVEGSRIQRAIDKKTAEESAKQRFDSMSDAERAALRQVIATDGIGSSEAVGTPGR